MAEEIGTFSNTWKVLIFDQDVETLARHAEPFEAQGFEVHKCMSIEMAMRCIEREEFDIAVVDQGSPAFEGRRVIGTWSVTTRLCRSSCGRGHGQGFGTGQTVVIDGGTVLV